MITSSAATAINPPSLGSSCRFSIFVTAALFTTPSAWTISTGIGGNPGLMYQIWPLTPPGHLVARLIAWMSPPDASRSSTHEFSICGVRLPGEGNAFEAR